MRATSYNIISDKQIAKFKASTTDVLIIDPKIMEESRAEWNNTLFGKFLGKVFSLHLVRSELLRQWGLAGLVFIANKYEGFFLFRFSCEEDMITILMEGPWLVRGSVLNLTKWKPNFRLSVEQISKAFVWARFLDLPEEYWKPHIFVDVAAMVGKPLRFEDITMVIGRGCYARAYVELDLTKPIKHGFLLGPKQIYQAVAYENLPLVCFTCGIVGHKIPDCPRRKKILVENLVPEVTLPIGGKDTPMKILSAASVAIPEEVAVVPLMQPLADPLLPT
ncbi:uncharacterized protein [Typha angustifolia]|uniref:uncharacterized protein n=1 Tax=Typha angustifolia TaxID=59011 RepID=UPI003C2B43BC